MITFTTMKRKEDEVMYLMDGVIRMFGNIVAIATLLMLLKIYYKD